MQTLAARIFPKCLTIFCLTFGPLFSVSALRTLTGIDLFPPYIVQGVMVYVMLLSGGASLLCGIPLAFMKAKEIFIKAKDNKAQIRENTAKGASLVFEILSEILKGLRATLPAIASGLMTILYYASQAQRAAAASESEEGACQSSYSTEEKLGTYNDSLYTPTGETNEFYVDVGRD